MSKGFQIAGGATVIALLLGWYAVSNLDAGASFAYYQSLADFQASAAEPDASVRVHGYVVLGSIARDVAGRRVTFAMQNDPPHAGGAVGPTLAVVYDSLETPDLFKDGAEVVVEGRVGNHGTAGTFRADRVLAKCPSKFEGKATSTASF